MEKKIQFVLDYLGNQTGGVDILNSFFVDAYIEKFNPPHRITFYGANKCPQLGRLLGAMYRKGLLKRFRVSISGQGYGFPKWVYTYEIPIWKRES